MTPLDIALCYESVLPSKGGAETYLGDLSRRLAADGHRVHLYACRWDAAALPPSMTYHKLTVPGGPRFLRPWRFGRAVEAALRGSAHDVTVGFDKTWGQDVLYPQGGLHAASRDHNLRKFSGRLSRAFGGLGKWLDPASRSFAALERRQYLAEPRPVVVVNSRMVAGHFRHYYGVEPDAVVHSAIDPARFAAADRGERRAAERRAWGVAADTPTALFIAMNYRLKGLAPLIRAAALLPAELPLKVAVVGHPKYGRYQRLAESLGVAGRFIFLGFRADPKDAYFAADFLVHPTFYDPCSLVALEALACGLPVVTTQYNGAAELLTVPDNGRVVHDPHDAGELAAALAATADPAYLAAGSEAARRAAAAWTFEQHYAALVEIFRGVRDRKRAKRD